MFCPQDIKEIAYKGHVRLDLEYGSSDIESVQKPVLQQGIPILKI